MDDEDPVINKLFDFYLHRDTDSYAFKWAKSLVDYNESQGDASAIKAMLISGLQAHEIANIFRVPELYVKVFLACYFDLEGYLDDERLISKIVFSFAPGNYDTIPEGERRERLWMYAALTTKWEGLRRVMSNSVNFDGSENEAIDKMIVSIMTQQARKYAMSLPMRGDCRPTDLEKLIAIKSAQGTLEQNKPQTNGHSTNDWTYLLLNKIVEKAEKGDMSPENIEKVNRLTDGARNLKKETPIIEVKAEPQSGGIYEGFSLNLPKLDGQI